MTRELVGYDGVLGLLQAYRMIDEAGQGNYFYRLIISPDPKSEDTQKDLHLSEIIENTMLYLEDRLQTQVAFVAAEHNDHTPRRHVHLLAILPGRLNQQDLAALRTITTEAALFQRQERDLARANEIQGRLPVKLQREAHQAEPRHSSRPGGKAQRVGSRLGRGNLDVGGICPRCGALLGSRQRACPSCGLELRRRKEVEWER